MLEFPEKAQKSESQFEDVGRNIFRMSSSSPQSWNLSVKRNVPELQKAVWLSLSNQDLTSLPDSVKELNHLTGLSLGGNHLSSLPESIGQTSSLKEILLDENQLVSLPRSIGKLTDLTKLSLHGNKLFFIPGSIGQLRCLNELILSNNRLTLLPESVGDLADLRVLHLHNNKLSDLPESTGNVRNLTMLSIFNNPVTELPESITKLHKLLKLLIEYGGKVTVQRAPIGITALPCWTNNDKDDGMTMSFSEALQTSRFYSNHISENITDIRSYMEGWKVCDRVNISNNEISALPDQLSALTDLCEIKLANNMFASFPDVLLKMSWLTSLDVSSNHFTELPGEITSLTKLANLVIKGSNGNTIIKRAPEGISKLPCYNNCIDIRHLIGNYSKENIIEIRPLIATWQWCERIDVSDNQISMLPEDLSTLTGLSDLNIANNKLSTFPDVILKMSWLANLDFSSNEITSLPPSLGLLENLRNGFKYENNPLVNPPKNVQRQGATAVFNYLRAARLGGMELWTQGRILLLGEGEVGKTTLRMSLMQLQQNRFARSLIESILWWTDASSCFSSTAHERERTEGVEIERDIYVPPHGLETPIQASIWDFGGQDIFHATHVFFLSYGALTVALYNVMKGPKRSRLGQWLEMVEHTSPDAHVLVVGTCLDQVPKEQQSQIERECIREIEEMTQRFNKISFSGHIQISNATGQGLKALEKIIYQELANLPNICKDVPRSYIKLKSYLESQRKSKKSRLGLDEIISYCGSSDLQMNRSESESALQFCVDLGVAVWQAQDISIRDTVFLDPEFLITAFRSIFNISNSKNMDGVILHRKLQKTLGETNFEQIIKLFRSMGLSYALSDSVEIFPILVRGREKSVPVQKWLVDPKTTREYTAYMLSFRNEIPKLEISRLIVGLLKMIDDKKIKHKSQLVYLGRNNIVLPFSIKDGYIEKGSEFLMRIELVDETEEELTEKTSNHDVRLPVCKNIIIHVQTGRKGCNTLTAAKVIRKTVIDSSLPRSSEQEGVMCPKCRSEGNEVAEIGLIDMIDLQLLKSSLKCTKGHQISQVDLKKWMLASGALNEEFQGNRTKKVSISQEMQDRRHLQIFLSSTFMDMKFVRESFTRFAQPIIEMEGRGLGFEVTFFDLRWGVSEEESKNGDTIFRCLDGVLKADYFVCFLGSRYGWIPNRESDLEWNKELVESSFSWVTKYPNASATELEIQGACLSENANLAYRSFFYERIQQDNTDELNQFDKEDREKQSILKDGIRKSFVVHEFTDAMQLIGQATKHITNAMRKDAMEINRGFNVIERTKTKSLLLNERGVLDRIKHDLQKHQKSLSKKQLNMLERQIKQGPLKNPILLNMVMEEIVSFGIFEDLKMLLDSLLSTETAEELMVRILRQWERSYDANGVRDMLVVLHLASQTLGVSWQGISDYLFGNYEDSKLLLKSQAMFSLLLRFDVLGIASVEGVGHDRYYVQYPLLCWAIDQSHSSDRAEKGAACAEYLKLINCELRNEANESIQVQLCTEITKTVCKIHDLRHETEDQPSEELLELGMSEVFLECLKNEVSLKRFLGDSAEKLGFQNQNEMWLRMLQTSSLAVVQLAEVLSDMPQLVESIDECLSKHIAEQEHMGAGYWNSELLYHLYCRRISVLKKLNRPVADIEEFQRKVDHLARDAFGELNF